MIAGYSTASRLSGIPHCCAALDGEDLDCRGAPAQLCPAQRLDREAWTWAYAAQEIGRDNQRPADLFAMLLQSRSHVDRVTEIGDLTA
jgi:hypothetical protein